MPDTRPSVDLRRLSPDDAPYGALTAYEVTHRGQVIGIVSQHVTTSYRKAGRLIAATFHPKRWAATLTGEPVYVRDAYLYTRRDAVESLLRQAD